MANQFLSPKKLEQLLDNLQVNGVETKHVDCKSILNLKEPGDRAALIRHVCAIANMGQNGYLIIGIEDKTWKPVGIHQDSSLANTDSTQKQINQILAGRIDPNISILYRIYPYKDKLIGVIHIPSDIPPYVISISEERYGGQKSDTKRDSYIHQGVVYIRRGSDSVVANRQSDLFAVLESRRNILGVTGALGLIGIVVSVGVGVGIAVIGFKDVYVPMIMGGSWGLLVGLLFSHRVTSSMGTFPKNIPLGIWRSSLGPVMGILTGVWLSYVLARGLLDGRYKVLDPFSMGLLIGPLILALNFIPILIVLLSLANIDLGRIFKRRVVQAPDQDPRSSDTRFKE